MTHTTKHTPTGEVMAHFNLSDEEWDGLPSFMQQKLTTVYCQHAAAPAMYEALSELVKYLREEVADEALDTWAPVFKAAMALAQARGEAECEGDTVEIKAAAVDISHIKAALAQAEGRQA